MRSVEISDRYTIKIAKLQKGSAFSVRVCEDASDFGYGYVEDEVPSVRVLSERVFLHEISEEASKSWRNAVEEHAYYFKREFRYDFVQYDADELLPQRRAFMWVQEGPPRYAFGSVCFFSRQYIEGLFWDLDWVWVHPYLRRQGLLSAAWPYFIRRFGAFNVTQPVSPAMQAFVGRHGKPEGEALDLHPGDPIRLAQSNSTLYRPRYGKKSSARS